MYFFQMINHKSDNCCGHTHFLGFLLNSIQMIVLVALHSSVENKTHRTLGNHQRIVFQQIPMPDNYFELLCFCLLQLLDLSFLICKIKIYIFPLMVLSVVLTIRNCS